MSTLQEAMERLRSEVEYCEETSLESVKLSTEQARALLDAARNADELQRLFDLQHTRSVEADEMWREAHPGNDLTMPDLGDLLTWLMERVRNAETAEARAIEKCMEGAEEAVKAYRTVYTADADGDGLSLDDILTPKGDATIARGIEERDNIIDDIRVAFRSLAAPERTCSWVKDDDGVYRTFCGHEWSYDDEDQEPASYMRYCLFCGAQTDFRLESRSE